MPSVTPDTPLSMAAPFDKYHTQKTRRPPIVAQHSSSVPSTPHQHPHDLRFPSRSPSPGRALNARSSNPAVSDAAGPHPAQRPAPVVCKFETGAEFRKRRIPYKDGGNEVLPRPKKEPKRLLEPFEDDKLSGDMRELYDRIFPTAESEERRVQLVKKLEDIFNQEWPGNDIKVNVFGSSGNLLSSSDSDVDVCITTSLQRLETMHEIATVLHRHGMEKVVCRASAKVPIVKIWDPVLQLACDMNVNNPLALENTRMIKTYVQMDDRVRPLAKIVKYWTKQRLLNDAAFGGTISSYTWICMIINFLQTRQPPVLPSLQRMPDSQKSTVDGKKSQFADDLDQLRGFGSANNESLGQLLFHFYRYYGYELDYSRFVVSVKEGRLLSRKEKGWDASNYHDKEARSRLCVEEPFNTIRNLGNSADDYAFSGIHEEMRRAFDLIADGTQLDECCKQYEFPLEEKPLFQRPAPRPKPTLTRSASQQDRAKVGTGPRQGNANSSKNSRNTSSHRSNNRRASSGAMFGSTNTRYTYLQSPTLAGGPNDYFGTNGMSTDQLHDQLYKQYAYLQAQQEALRSQLMLQQNQTQAQAQAQAQSSSRPMDSNAPPHQRSYANSLPNPRLFDNGSSSAPLLPGYLYHYPARYPASSPLSQARTNDGAATNPSSPSLSTATPSTRRGVHRGSIPEPMSTTSTRSQSQPGRSFPNPVTLQSLAHPGYDVSGAIGTPYFAARPMMSTSPGSSRVSMPMYASASQQNGLLLPDSAMPKEYVGYYVGQSPQLIPQYASSSLPPAPMLQDLTHRPRRLSPERLAASRANSQSHLSRSPSPLGQGRRTSVASSQSKSSPLPQGPFPETNRPPRRVVEEGPLIVNGSSPVIVNGSTPIQVANEPIPNAVANIVGPTYGLGLENIASPGSGTSIGEITLVSQEFKPEERGENHDARRGTMLVNPNDVQPSISAVSREPEHLYARPANTQDVLSNGQHTSSGITNSSEGSESAIRSGATGGRPDISPLLTAKFSLLSPVAEMRTPSPTTSPAFGGLSAHRFEPAKSARAALCTPKDDASTGFNTRALKHASVAPQLTPASSALTSAPNSTNQSPMPLPYVPSNGLNSALIASTNGSSSAGSGSNGIANSSNDNIHGNGSGSSNTNGTTNGTSKTNSAAGENSASTSVSASTNPWQQATRKGHKKNKSSASRNLGASAGVGGLEAMPVTEAERKGG